MIRLSVTITVFLAALVAKAQTEVVQTDSFHSPEVEYRFNNVSQTHYDDYQNYLTEIQSLIDKQIELLVLQMWNDVKVDKKKYEEYYQKLSKAN